MQWNFGGRAPPAFFEAHYNCSSTAVAGRDVDEGDKIYLPPSALDKLARMNIEYPMLFEMTNEFIGKKTHCGVLEFSAEEGWCYMPFWMMQNLLMEEGGLVKVKNVSLAKASFVKLRAQSVDFLEVSNHRALLEVALRKFTCLTVGDTICIPYGKQKFYLDIREVQPNGCASIIETDCNVDFEEPLGYKDSKYAQYERDREAAIASQSGSAVASAAGSTKGSKDSLASMAESTGSTRVLQKARVTTEEEALAEANSFKAFSGTAKRIDGKVPTSSGSSNGASAANGTSSSSGGIAASQPKANSAKYYEDKFAASSSSAKGTPPVPAAAAAPQPVAYQSRIGDKYSKKKAAVSAFTGTAHKLS